VTDVVKDHAKRLVSILKEELVLEKEHLTDKLHMRTLERIFIEERIYKRIETMKTAEGVINAVLKGFEPFRAELIRDVTADDVERLLKIPIRRISLYDINKNREEVAAINARIKEINRLLKNLVDYAISVLNGILEKIPVESMDRRTKITSFTKVDVKEAVTRNLSLKYDRSTGYLGTAVTTGTEIMKVSPYDRIVILRKSGVYTVLDVPEKLFVDKGMWFCGLSDKDVLSKILFTIVYKDGKTGYPCIKRCRIEGYILNRDYLIVPDDAKVLLVGTRDALVFTVKYTPKPRIKTRSQVFNAKDFREKGLKAQGVRLAPREVSSVVTGALKDEEELPFGKKDGDVKKSAGKAAAKTPAGKKKSGK